MNDKEWQKLLALSKRSLIAWWKHSGRRPQQTFVFDSFVKNFDLPLFSREASDSCSLSYPASFCMIQTNIENTHKTGQLFSVFLFLRIIRGEECFYGGYHHKIKEYKPFLALTLFVEGILTDSSGQVHPPCRIFIRLSSTEQKKRCRPLVQRRKRWRLLRLIYLRSLPSMSASHQTNPGAPRVVPNSRVHAI